MKSMGEFRKESWSWGLLAVLVLMAGIVLSGCQTSGGNRPETPSPESSAPETSASSGGASPGENAVRHAMGETKVKGAPQRVVVLDNGALDNVLALGIKPVGAPTVQLEQPYPNYLKAQTEGIVNIGTIDEPNLESVAKLQPDLILGSKDTHEKIYDKLKQIAPTVFVETLGYTWKENLKLQAQALGREAEADKLLAGYNDKITKFQTQMGDRLASTEVSVLRPRKDHVRIYLKESFSGIIVSDMGLPRPAAQQGTGLSAEATEEQVANLDGDVIFWFTRDTEHLLNTKLASNPLWQKLKAVQANRVYEVDPETWLSGLGVQAANLVVDDVHKLILQEK